MEGQYLIATLYIFYGITKLIIGLSLMTFPIEIIKKIPVLNWFIKQVADKTLAGRFYEYVLLFFGVYTILHGLALFGVFPAKYNALVEKKWVLYSIFLFLGSILTIFYCLVLYTDLPISKNKDDYSDYKLLGLGGGIGFLVFPLIWEAFDHVVPFFRSLSTEMQNLVLITFTIILFFVIDLIYNYMHRRNIKLTAKNIVPTDYQNAYTHVAENTAAVKSGVVQQLHPASNVAVPPSSDL